MTATSSGIGANPTLSTYSFSTPLRNLLELVSKHSSAEPWWSSPQPFWPTTHSRAHQSRPWIITQGTYASQYCQSPPMVLEPRVQPHTPWFRANSKMDYFHGNMLSLAHFAKLAPLMHSRICYKTMIVSDASIQKNGQSGFAWLIAQDQNLVWCGTGLAPGPADDTYSGQAKAYRLLVAITFLSFYMKCYDTMAPMQNISCYCDNIGAIMNLTSMQNGEMMQPNDTTANDYDLYTMITALAVECQPIQLRYIHVKGHQDHKSEWPLTNAEIHNVDCDRLAKQLVQQSTLQSTTLATLAFEAAQLHLLIAGWIICHKVIPALWKAAAAPECWAYLQNQFKWMQADLNSIQWTTLASALNSFPCSGQWRIIFSSTTSCC